jgi:hypothetical protein
MLTFQYTRIKLVPSTDLGLSTIIQTNGVYRLLSIRRTGTRTLDCRVYQPKHLLAMDVLLGLDLGWSGIGLGMLVCAGILSTAGVEAQGEEVSFKVGEVRSREADGADPRGDWDRARKTQSNPEIYAPIEKSDKSFLQAVAISCKTPFSKSIF